MIQYHRTQCLRARGGRESNLQDPPGKATQRPSESSIFPTVQLRLSIALQKGMMSSGRRGVACSLLVEIPRMHVRRHCAYFFEEQRSILAKGHPTGFVAALPKELERRGSCGNHLSCATQIFECTTCAAARQRGSPRAFRTICIVSANTRRVWTNMSAGGCRRAT